MASTTIFPATRAGSKVTNLCRGMARTTMSASSTASSAHRGSAPGISTWVMSAISSGYRKRQSSRGSRRQLRLSRSLAQRAPHRARPDVARALAPTPHQSCSTNPGTSNRIRAKMALQRPQDIAERLELFSRQCISEVLFDGPHMRRRRPPEDPRTVSSQGDLSASAVGGTVVAADQAPLLHPSELMG
jgi:hypothetical protein